MKDSEWAEHLELQRKLRKAEERAEAAEAARQEDHRARVELTAATRELLGMWKQTAAKAADTRMRATAVLGAWGADQ